jgi:hypothetical protein
MSNLLCTDLHPTTTYHPQANGLMERNHRDLKAALKCRLNSPNWIDELPWVLLGLRTAPKEDLHSLSAELVYGSPLTVPVDFFPDNTPRSAPRELQQQRIVLAIYVLSQQRSTGKPASSLTFRAPLKKRCLFLSDVTKERPLYRPRMMVLSK